MRVLHININYTVSALHQTMIEHLNNTGIESSVFIPTYDRSKTILELNDNVILSECFKKNDRFFYFKKQKKIIEDVKKKYNVSSFDCIHAYTLFSDGNVAMELSTTYGIPYVVAVRNTDLNVFFKKLIYLRSRGVEILRNAKAVFFLSKSYQDKVLNDYVPEIYQKEILHKSYLIPNGIDDFWLENIERKNVDLNRLINQKEIHCLYVGNIDKNKNTELTLRALESLNNDGWKCDLISIGKIVDLELFKKLKCYSFYEYIEPQKKESLIRYYRDADLFIMPSHTETFGLVYAEAMSQGLPVIYTRGQGFDGQFQDGEVGYPTSDTNTAQLKTSIIYCIKDYERISENCVKGVEKYNWDKIVVRYSEIYHECVKGNGL